MEAVALEGHEVAMLEVGDEQHLVHEVIAAFVGFPKQLLHCHHHVVHQYALLKTME